jgi:hypothetical protein
MLRPTPERVAELRELAGDDPLLLTMAPEVNGGLKGFATARELGIRVSIGHTNAPGHILRGVTAAGPADWADHESATKAFSKLAGGRLVAETGRRLGLHSVRPLVPDLCRPLPRRMPQRFDAILVDAPCSGLGVLRRRADLRWRKQPGDLEQLATIQLQILTNCSKYLKVGGRIIYATCTTCRNENQEVIEKFLTQNRDFRIIPRTEIRAERLQNLINHNNFLETSFIEGAQMDGFFAALMTRIS